MTMLRTNEAGVPQTVNGEELTEANIAELLRAQADQETAEAATPRQRRTVESTPAEEERTQERQSATTEQPNLEALVRSTLAREVAPQLTALQNQLKTLGDQVAFAARRGNEVPPEVYQAITTLSQRLEAQEMAAMTPEEQVEYLRNKEQQQEAARQAAWQRQQEEARQQAERERTAAASTTNSNAEVEAVRQAAGEEFANDIMPSLLEVAARYGISEAEARADMVGDKAVIELQPVLKDGKLTGYNFFRYGRDIEKVWAERSEKNDGARSSRATGSAARPGGSVPKGFDAWDDKWNKNVNGLLEEVVRASGGFR